MLKWRGEDAGMVGRGRWDGGEGTLEWESDSFPLFRSAESKSV